METIFPCKHQQIRLQSSYEAFGARLESIVKKLDPQYAKDSLANPERVRSYLESIQGESGLIIFNIRHHGEVLNLYGKPRKAKQYDIGNPLVAIQMTVHDIRVALYAPLRLIVYESCDGNVFAEFDLPSSLFGQFENKDILTVAEGLDLKLLNAIAMADKISEEAAKLTK